MAWLNSIDESCGYVESYSASFKMAVLRYGDSVAQKYKIVDKTTVYPGLTYAAAVAAAEAINANAALQQHAEVSRTGGSGCYEVRVTEHSVTAVGAAEVIPGVD